MGICSGLDTYLPLPNNKFPTFSFKNVIIGNNSIFISYRSSVQGSCVRYPPPTGTKMAIAAIAARSCRLFLFCIDFPPFLTPLRRKHTGIMPVLYAHPAAPVHPFASLPISYDILFQAVHIKIFHTGRARFFPPRAPAICVHEKRACLHALSLCLFSLSYFIRPRCRPCGTRGGRRSARGRWRRRRGRLLRGGPWGGPPGRRG